MHAKAQNSVSRSQEHETSTVAHADTAEASPPNTRRRGLPERDKFLVWVRAGGCCELCGRYLLEGPITRRPYRLGELAHIVGQGTGPRSPRGQVEMSAKERDSADNLMLLCPNEHEEIDRHGSLDVATIYWLRGKKRAHEERIRRLASMAHDQRTAVLRVIGDVQGEPVAIAMTTAADTVARAGRYADFPLTFDRAGIEIDLRGIPGEAGGGADYWRAAIRKIDEGIARLAEGLRDDEVRHVSVFAFARLPLLVYVGAALDDTFQIDPYQRHRSDETWDWRDGPDVQFKVTRPDHLGEEAVLIVNVSGTIDEGQLPEAIGGLPRTKLELDGATPGVDAITSRAALRSFETAVRGLLAGLEIPSKSIRRLHVVAAVPMSAAVAIGRAHNGTVHPALAIYARAGHTFEMALEIP